MTPEQELKWMKAAVRRLWAVNMRDSMKGSLVLWTLAECPGRDEIDGLLDSAPGPCPERIVAANKKASAKGRR